MIQFAKYGSGYITLDDILVIQNETKMLWAHAEDSGCESCYCEVARWNERTERWERFCVVKCLDYRLPELPDASDEETAVELAKRINEPLWDDGRASIVHSMPNFVEKA